MVRFLPARFCALPLAAALGALAHGGFSATVTVGDYYGSGSGGEFSLTPSGLSFTPYSLGEVAGAFESFCIERDENVSFGGTYYVDLNTAAVGGGIAGGSPDPLSDETAYLYSQFIKGALEFYAYDVSGGTAARIASADALQDVIWYLEEEQGLTWTPGDNSLRDVFYQDALDNAPSGIGDVRVLNLYRDPDGEDLAQDQLVRIPEPGTFGLIALASLGLVLRRR